MLSFDTNPLLPTISRSGAPSGISSAHIDLSHIRGYIQSSWPIAGTKNPSLLLVSLYLLTIPLQHLSVTSIEILCKHTKALFAKFLVKFAHKTASSSTSSWDLVLKHDVLTLNGNFAKQAELISSLIDDKIESFHHQSMFCSSLSP